MTSSELTAFVFWNRRGGALNSIVKELAGLQAEQPDMNLIISVSDQNELSAAISQFGWKIELFSTFTSTLGALTGLPRLLLQLRRLISDWKKAGVTSVVVLMPHVWTPVLGYYVRKAGMKYAIIVHDADPHTGDATAVLNPWLHIDVKSADVVFTLSQSVSEKLIRQRHVSADRIVKLFHPRISYPALRPERPHSPLRVLFLGRILAYKGLPLLVSAIEQINSTGNPVDFGVAGEGEITALLPRLFALRAEIINGWMTDAKVDELLLHYDLVVLPYTEASQSGVIMIAHGAGLPVVVTPVGGLAEQVEHNVTGLVATAPDPTAIAECIQQFQDRDFYRKIVGAIEAKQSDFSVEVFSKRLIAALRKTTAMIMIGR